MKHFAIAAILAVLLIALIDAGAQEKAATPGAMTFALACGGGDCPLLTGAPQTSGMRGGAVKLKTGESVGWHSTGEHEEALVILHGAGAVNIDGQADVVVHERMLAYVPPRTKHNVTNTGTETLEYAWIVAAVSTK
ncbi:MAG: cupin domain-containing protein [Candidatus Acidiferrales bacterium]